MMHKERLLKIIEYPHVSEKSTSVLERCNTISLRVSKHATKSDIKDAVCMLFSVKVEKINVLITSKKMKRLRNKIGYRRNWKKAYVVLRDGHKVDFRNKIQ